MNPSTPFHMDLSRNILSGIVVPEDTKSINLSHNNLDSLRGLKLPSSLKRLNLGGNVLTTLEGFEIPEKIEKLILSGNSSLKWKTILPSMNTLSNLTFLDLNRVFVAYKDFQFLLKIESLNRLNAPVIGKSVSVGSSPRIKKLPHKEKIFFPPNLVYLSILNNFYIDSWEQLIFPPKLKSLHIRNNPMMINCYGYTDMDTLDSLVLPSSLEKFQFYCHYGTKKISEIVFPPSLKSLNLQGCPLTNKLLSSLPKVEELDICNCPGLTSLSQLKNPSLEKLKFDGFSVVEIGDFEIPENLKYTLCHSVRGKNDGLLTTHHSGIYFNSMRANVRRQFFGRVWHDPYTWGNGDIDAEYKKAGSLVFFEQKFVESLEKRVRYLSKYASLLQQWIPYKLIERASRDDCELEEKLEKYPYFAYEMQKANELLGN